MNQEDINDLMWKSMADWQKNVVIDGGNLSAAKRRIKELEAELEQLKNTPSISECQHEYEYVNTTPFIGHKCKKCGHCI